MMTPRADRPHYRKGITMNDTTATDRRLLDLALVEMDTCGIISPSPISPIQRTILSHRVTDGRTLEQTAEILRMERTAVRQQEIRALLDLRRAWQRQARA